MALFNKDWNTYKRNWQNADGVRGKLKSIISSNDVNCIKEFNTQISNGIKPSEAYKNTMVNCSKAAKQEAVAIAKGNSTLQEAEQALDSAESSTIGLTIAHTALNAVIGLGVGLLVNFAVKRISKLINYQQDLIDKSEEAISVFEESRDSLSNTKQTIDDISSDYAKLAQGVDSLGRNVSLNTEEYSRYNEIANKIADIFPQMIQGYTDEGNAIIANKGNVEELTRAYEEQKNAYQDLVITKSAETFDGYKAKVVETSLPEKLKGKRGTYAYSEQKKYIDELIESLEKGREAFEDFYSNQYIGNSDIYSVLYSATKTAGIDWVGIMNTDERYEQMKTQMTKLYAYQRQLVSNINTETAKIKPIMSAYLEQSYDYQALDSNVQDVVSQIVGQFDSEFYMQFDNETDMASWVTENIVNKFKGVNGKKVADAFENAIDLKTKLQNGEISLDEYLSGIREFKTLIDGFDNSTEKSVELIFNVNSSSGLSTDTMVNNVKDKLQDEFDDKVGTLTIDDLEISANLEIPDGTLLSWDELIERIEKVKSETFDSEPDDLWDYSTTITQLDTIKEKFDVLDSTLSKLYDTDESTVIGFDDFSSMNEAFKDLDGIETYIQRLQEAGQDTEAVTAVMSDLISAYLEYSGVLDNVTDENRQLITSMLEEAGASETVRNYLMLLSAQENIFSNQGLNVTEKIARLQELAKEYGNTALAASIAAKMEAASENAALGQTGYTFEDAFNEAKAEFESSASAVNIDFKGTDVSAAVSSGSAAGDAYTDAFEKELDELDSLKDRGIITEKEYLDTLRSLYERYFKDRAGYLDEYEKYERQYLEGMKSLYDSALSGISKLMGSRIDALTQSKEAAVAGLEAQQAASEAAYQAQIDDIQTQIDAIDSLIDEKNKQVDAINEEIDKINEASKARKREIDLQKAQYELERMQNQRTTLQYTEGKGMHYVQDTGGVRDAREAVTGIREEIQVAELEKQISLIEKEIDLLEGRKDALKSQQDALRQMMDESNNYYDTLIKQQETYWNSLIQNLEQQKSKWEQLAEIEEIADAYSKVQQVFGSMGYTIEDILNGNEQAFEDFKSKYVSLISDLNSNSSFTDGLSYAVGSSEDSLNSFLDKAQGISDCLGAIEEKASVLSGMDTGAGGISDTISGISDALNSFPADENINNLAAAFINLGDAIKGVSDAIGINSEETVGSLIGALQSISGLSLSTSPESDENKGPGIISQFSSLKNAVDEVTNAISGGSGSSPGNGSSPSGTGMNTGAAKSGTGGLTGAMDALKSAADEALGSPDGSENAKGSGAIGKFEQLKAAVDDAAGSIGTGGENSGAGTEAGGDDTGSNDTGTLTGTVISMGETARETLGESGGEGVIGKFEEFSDVISKANEHVTGISNGLKAIDGQEAECTIKIHIEQYGSTIGGAAMAAGTALNAMNLNSAAYSARYGNSLAQGTAHFEGAALASGSWAVQSNAAKALMGELGYEIIVRNGRFFTVCENGAGIVPIKKGDIVFNHKQSEQLLKYGHISGRGRAYADGTVGSPLASGRLLPLADNHPSMELQRKFSAYMDKVTRNLDELIFPVNKIHKNMGNMSNVINNLNTINTTANQITINKLDLSCPNVTNSSGIEYIQKELGHLSLRALQEPAGN